MPLWSCPTCSKSFARKGDLTRHKLIHTGIKPHVCEFCGKGFTQFSGLKTHRNVHTKFKPHVCGIGTCKKAFGDPSSCTRHRRETHSREGAYKCTVPDCGIRIKRRSAFVAHLQRHGLDPISIDLDAIVQKGGKRGTSAPTHLASLDVESKSNTIGSRSTSSSSLIEGSWHSTPGHSGETVHFTDSGGLPGDNSFGCGRANWSLANSALPLGLMLDQTANAGPSGYSNDIHAYPSSDFENSLGLDSTLIPPVNCPHFIACPSDLPTLDSFLETVSDGSQSSWSSPSSTYSALYTTNFNNDVMSLSLTDNLPQEPLVYFTM